jgi:amino acid permease
MVSYKVLLIFPVDFQFCSLKSVQSFKLVFVLLTNKMEGQSDKIEPTTVVETKTATYLGSQRADSASDGSHDAEKQGISQRPELKRKLKSRHLQMIAIGMFTQTHLVI